ncbi:MAG: peptidylprolyl isomerase [Pseudomonadota bacterium]
MKEFHASLLIACVVSLSATPQLASAQLLEEAPITRNLQIELASPQLAEQGNAVVTIADLEAYLSRIPESDRGGFLRSRTRIGEAVENLMLPRLLMEEARDQGYLDDADLQAKLFQSAVVLIGQEYMNHYFRIQELDDYNVLAREIYLTEPERFRTPQTVDFTHVLVAPSMERGDLGVMRRILEVYEQLTEGKTLEELAPEYSDDPSVAENGGSFVDVDPAALDENFSLTLSLLQPGQRSEPVYTQFGWHIIRLDGFNEPRQLSWEEAQERALELARIRHFDRARERLVMNLRADQIEIDPEKVQVVLDRYGVDWRLVPED